MAFCCSCTFLPHRISSPSILGLAASRHAPFRDLGFVPNAQKNWSHFPLAILVYKSTVDYMSEQFLHRRSWFSSVFLGLLSKEHALPILAFLLLSTSGPLVGHYLVVR